MSQDIFNKRIKRIERNGPSGTTIPGQVGEPERREIRAVRAASAHPQRRLQVVITILIGGILGAVAGLSFQHVVGVEALLSFDWRAEIALIERDMMRMIAWGTVAIGAVAVLVSLPSAKRFRKLAAGSAAYLASAIGVNANQIMALLPVG